jgi:hypothetical protein
VTIRSSLLVNQADALPGVAFPALTSAGSVNVLSANSLTSVSFPVLQTVSGTFQVAYVPALTALSAPALVSVIVPPPSATIKSVGILSTALTTISLPSLTTAQGGMELDSNWKVTALDLPALRTVNGSLSVTRNTALKQCLADALKTQLTTGPTSWSSSGNDGLPNTCP